MAKRNYTKHAIDYNNKFNKEHYTRISVLIPSDDKDLLEFVMSKKSKSAYLLNLIREDMNKKTRVY